MSIPPIQTSLVDRSNHIHMLIGMDIYSLKKRLDQLEDTNKPTCSSHAEDGYSPAGIGAYYYNSNDTDLIQVQSQTPKRDIKLIPAGEYGVIDMALTDQGDLLHDSGLETAVILSLFSDERHDGKRGHWADELIGRKSGSLLWLLKREKQQNITLRRAEDYAKAALKWVLVQRIAHDMVITAHWSSDGYLRLRIVFNLIAGTVFHRQYQ